jgi:hypothetical protein
MLDFILVSVVVFSMMSLCLFLVESQGVFIKNCRGRNGSIEKSKVTSNFARGETGGSVQEKSP